MDDCVVIGAGYAGLAAARRLSQAGRSVVVVEARDRVGGRVWTAVTPDGDRVDLGGTWIGGPQTAVYALAAELGVATYPTHADGDRVFVHQGVSHRYLNSIAEVVPQYRGAGRYMRLLDEMARDVPIEAPWTADRAAEWDAISLRAWLDAAVPEPAMNKQLGALLVTLFTADLRDVSLLNALLLIAGAGSLTTLLAIEGGYQQDHLTGGAQSIADAIAAELGPAVRLGARVERIEQADGAVDVAGDGFRVSARAAVCAAPIAVLSELTWVPALPDARAALCASARGGAVIKFACVYPEPFWREDGLSGESMDYDGTVMLTMDASPVDAGYGVLVGFSVGPAAEELAGRSEDERRALLLETMTGRFGDRAGSPTDLLEHDWLADPLTRGAYMSHFPVGVLSSVGQALAEPFGRVHFAGSETSGMCHGSIDAAIRSGQRAAAEVLARG